MAIKNKNIAIPSALLSIISVQSGASIAKNLFPFLGAAGTGTLRIGLSAVILLLINRPKIFKFTCSEWLYTLGYGSCLGFMNLFFYYAIQRIPLGLGVTVEFIGPLSVALLTSKHPLDIVWAILAAVGIMLIIPSNNTGIDILGLIFALTAGALWAGYIVLGSKVSLKMKGTDAITAGMCVATLLILPIGILSHDLDTLNIHFLLIGVGVAVFSSAVPYSLDLVALKRLHPKTFSILQSLQPAFGALSGLVFLKEILLGQQWLAILCVVAASIGATLFAQSKKTNSK